MLVYVSVIINKNKISSSCDLNLTFLHILISGTYITLIRGNLMLALVHTMKAHVHGESGLKMRSN